MTTRDDLSRFNYQLRIIESLRKISRSLHKLSEHDCNYSLTDRQQKREDKLKEKASELAKEINPNLRVYYQGDPRGCQIYLLTPDIDDNNYPAGLAIY